MLCKISRKCLIYAETLWAIDRGGLLASYWLETRWEMLPRVSTSI
jgi:hypothetical protein